jgi:hypothetical protein
MHNGFEGHFAFRDLGGKEKKRKRLDKLAKHRRNLSLTFSSLLRLSPRLLLVISRSGIESRRVSASSVRSNSEHHV